MQNNINFKPIISLLIFVLSIFTLIVFIGKVLIPFITALILTYILNPIVEKITTKFKISRSLISLILSIMVFLLFISIPLYIIPTLFIQFKNVLINIPNIINIINNKILFAINHKYNTNFNIDFNNIKYIVLNNFKGISNNINIFSPIAKNGLIVLEVILYIILIPFILFYSIINWHVFIKFVDDLIPKSYLMAAHNIFKDIDTMLAAYLHGQISVMIIMALYYSIGLKITGLDSGVVIGLLTGTLVFIPYLGILTGLLIALSVSLAGFQGMTQIFYVLGVFGIGHILEGALVTPFLVGGKIGLNPIMVILALMIFSKLFGFVGVLLALPLSTITVVLLKHAKSYYMKSKYYSEEQ